MIHRNKMKEDLRPFQQKMEDMFVKRKEQVEERYGKKVRSMQNHISIDLLDSLVWHAHFSDPRNPGGAGNLTPQQARLQQCRPQTSSPMQTDELAFLSNPLWLFVVLNILGKTVLKKYIYFLLLNEPDVHYRISSFVLACWRVCLYSEWPHDSVLRAPILQRALWPAAVVCVQFIHVVRHSRIQKQHRLQPWQFVSFVFIQFLC